jgi:hypothetical protein
MKEVPAAMFVCAMLLSAQADDHAMTLLKQAIALREQRRRSGLRARWLAK